MPNKKDSTFAYAQQYSIELYNRYKDLPRYPDADMDWHTTAKNYLKQCAYAEYYQELAAWVKSGKSKNTFNYRISRYLEDMTNCLQRNDKAMFYGKKLQALVIPETMKD